MLSINKVQTVQNGHLFNSSVLTENHIENNSIGYEDYRSASLSKSKISGKVKANLAIAYFVVLTTMIFLLFA